MKVKFKKIWNDNKIIIIMGGIVLICIIAMLSVMIGYFVGTGKSNYGDRLVKSEENPLKEEDKNNYESKVKEKEVVTDVDIHSSGNIIYIKISFSEKATIEEAKSIATSSLEFIGANYQEIYDLNFTLKQNDTDNSDGFTLMGAKNVTGSGLIWTNETNID